MVLRFQVPDESTRPSLWRPPLGSHSIKKKGGGHECVLRRICFLVLLGMLPWLVILPPQATSAPSCRRRSSSSQSLWSTQWEGGSTLTTTQVRPGQRRNFYKCKTKQKKSYLMNTFTKTRRCCSSELLNLMPELSSVPLHLQWLTN